MRVVLSNRRGFAEVDARDYPTVNSAGPWFLHPNGYATHRVRKACQGWTSEFLHQFLMGRRAGYTVDHINRNGLDCRRSNMRWATKKQQQSNRGKLTHNTSGYIGVSWHRASGKWQAVASVDKRRKHLGLFSDPTVAAQAYDRVTFAECGEFAVLNFQK